MSQFLRPDSDVTTTNVSAGGFGSIDESSFSDADFVIGTNNTTATYECGLSNPGATPGAGTCTVRFRHARGDSDTSPFAPASGGTGTPTVTCAVIENTTAIATDSAQNVVDGTFTAREFTFATSLVTDWTNLRLRFTLVGTGGAGANRRSAAVSWAEIEVPDAAAAPVELVVTDLSHAHPVDATALTQANTLAIQDLLDAHALDAVALVQANTLSMADLSHAHSLDAFDVTAFELTDFPIIRMAPRFAP